MEVGRELDLLIAQEIFNLTDEQTRCWPPTVADFLEAKVSGYTLQPHEQRHPDGYYVWWECLRDRCANKIIEGQEPPTCYQTVKMYSSDISAAWEVIEHMNSKGYPMRLELDWHGPKVSGGGYAKVGFADGKFVQEKTVPLAVCLAALRVFEED